MNKRRTNAVIIDSILVLITIIGFALSPITLGDDFYSNIPFSLLLTWIITSIYPFDYNFTLGFSYVFSNILGLGLFYFGIRQLKIRNHQFSEKLQNFMIQAKSNKKNIRYVIAGLMLLTGFYSYLYLYPTVWSIAFLFVGMIGILILLNIPSDWIEDSFATISNRFKISSVLAGGLFLAIASSSTEFFTSLSGVVWHGIFSIGFDTLVWSSLFNLCMILGVCTFYKPTLHVSSMILKRDMPFYGLTIGGLLFLAMDGKYTTLDFVILISLYLVYIGFLYFDKEEPYQETTDDSWSMVTYKLIFGLLTIALLAHTLVTFGQKSIEIIDVAFNYTLPIGVLACTIYGPGTSIADMFMSIAATKKGEDSAAVVNTIGSNTFDLTICLAVPGLIYTLNTGQDIIINLQSSFLLIVMLLVSFLMVVFFLWDKKITHKEGIILIIYFVSCVIVYMINILELF